jgi:intein/homing endonuclease
MPHKRKDLKIEGPNLWYLIGLITSDGCLSKDGRHIDITSSDYQFLRGIKNLIGIGNKIGIKYGYKKQKAFRILIANRSFYDFLLSLGLTHKKSLTVGALDVPKQFFVDFLRGLIDGDGSMRSWKHPTNFRQQWSLRIYSGSKKFLEWLDEKIKEYLKACGKLYQYNKQGTAYVLKFGKMAAREITKSCYYEGCFGLQRKIALAKDCTDSYKGWSKSRTVNYELS